MGTTLAYIAVGTMPKTATLTQREKQMKTKQLQTEVSRALETANTSYIARTAPGAVKVNKNGIQPDIAHAQSTIATLTLAQWDSLATLDIGRDMVRAIGSAPVKVAKRIAQVFAVLAGADASKHLKGSARTLFLSVGAVTLAGCKSRDGLSFAVCGKGNEHSSDSVNLTLSRQMQRMGVTSPASFATQYSVCFANQGMGAILGIGRKGKKGEMPEVNQDAPLTRAIVARINTLTEIETQAVKGSDEPGEGSGE